MLEITLDYEDSLFFAEAFKEAPAKMERALVQAMTQAMESTKERLQDEPAQAHITRTEAYGKPFQSDRQRRWFFAALASGALVVPYPRSGLLSSSWQIEVVALPPDGVTGRVWTTVPYAKYPLDAMNQSLLLTYWQTMDEIRREMQPLYNEGFAEAAKAAFRITK